VVRDRARFIRTTRTNVTIRRETQDTAWTRRQFKATRVASVGGFYGVRSQLADNLQIILLERNSDADARTDGSFSSSLDITLTPSRILRHAGASLEAPGYRALLTFFTLSLPRRRSKFVRESNCQDRLKLCRERRQTILKDENRRRCVAVIPNMTGRSCPSPSSRSSSCSPDRSARESSRAEKKRKKETRWTSDVVAMQLKDR